MRLQFFIDALAVIAALAGLVCLAIAFFLTEGSADQLKLAVFGIALAVIPYCIASLGHQDAGSRLRRTNVEDEGRP